MKMRIRLILLHFLAILPLALSAQVFQTENQLVYHFVRDFEYDNDDYDYSYVKKYIRKYPIEERSDWPQPVLVEELIPGLSYRQDYIFTLTDKNARKAEEKQYRSVERNKKKGYLLYNLEPGKTYELKVYLEKNNELVGSSSFSTTGQVRMLNVGVVRNVRDIGGWQTVDGGRLRYGKIIRGGEIDESVDHHKPTQSELVSLLEAGVTSELDLRGDYPPSPLGDNARYVAYDMMNFTFIEDEALCAGAVKVLANELSHGHNVYIHCKGGADRTGLLCFLVEGACGVSESDLCKDYEMTSFSDYGMRHRDSEEGGYRDAVAYIKSFRGSSLKAKFYNYLMAGGMTRDEIDRLVKAMVDHSQDPQSAIRSPQSDPADDAVYNLHGQRVGTHYKGIVIRNGRKVMMKP